MTVAILLWEKNSSEKFNCNSKNRASQPSAREETLLEKNMIFHDLQVTLRELPFHEIPVLPLLPEEHS